MAHKRALIVGINYTGTGNDLKGCINDANNVQRLLSDKFGFTDIRVLTEKDATTQGIKDSLRWLVSGCCPGDTLVFHYSGHGSQIPDTSDPDVEPDELDEIICPIDLDWREKVITDDYMKWAFDTVPADVNLTVILDCCHSGTALDQENQYQPTISTAPTVSVNKEEGKGRFLPPPADVQQLIDSIKAKPKTRNIQSRDVNKTGLLISGCRSQQTSADAYINGVYQGAATYSLLNVLKDFNYHVAYDDLIEEMNDYMVTNGYSQRPELNGSASLFSMNFLEEPKVTQQIVNEYEPVDVPAPPPTQQNTQTVLNTIQPPKKKNFFQLLLEAIFALFGKK